MKTLKKNAFQTLSFLVSLLLSFPAQNVLFAQVMPAAAPVSATLPTGLVGVVAAARGSVQIAKSGQVGRIAGSGEPIYLGDEVSTDGKGQLQILLLDETVFTIGPNSAIVIDTFVYDPATFDGKIDARVVKGVFRFITGQIAHKKPSNVEIKLPTGSVGVRGTIFYGKVEGDSSLILLLGPGEKNNTGHRQGRIIVSNDVNGKNVETEVKKSGFGTFIGGENIAPTAAFEVPREQVEQMIASVNPAESQAAEPAKETKSESTDDKSSGQTKDPAKSEEPKSPERDNSAAPADRKDGDKPARPAASEGESAPASGSTGKTALMGPPPGAPPVPGSAGETMSPGHLKPMMGGAPQERPALPDMKSATQQAQQDKVVAYDFLRDLSQVNQINNDLFTQSTTSSLDAGDRTGTSTTITQQLTGQATFDQLRARTEVGTSHYTGSGTMTHGSYTLTVDINFGSRTIGGGNSNVQVTSTQFNSGSAFNFALSSIVSFTGLSGDAIKNITGLSADYSGDTTGSLNLSFQNGGDSVNHTLSIENSTQGKSDTGSGTASLQAGAS